MSLTPNEKLQNIIENTIESGDEPIVNAMEFDLQIPDSTDFAGAGGLWDATSIIAHYFVPDADDSKNLELHSLLYELCCLFVNKRVDYKGIDPTGETRELLHRAICLTWCDMKAHDRKTDADFGEMEKSIIDYVLRSKKKGD